MHGASVVYFVATQTSMPSLDMSIDAKTASGVDCGHMILTAPEPGPQFEVAPDDAALACIVEVPDGPMYGFGGGYVWAMAEPVTRAAASVVAIGCGGGIA